MGDFNVNMDDKFTIDLCQLNIYQIELINQRVTKALTNQHLFT